jgi:hypothetical protein
MSRTAFLLGRALLARHTNRLAARAHDGYVIVGTGMDQGRILWGGDGTGVTRSRAVALLKDQRRAFQAMVRGGSVRVAHISEIRDLFRFLKPGETTPLAAPAIVTGPRALDVARTLLLYARGAVSESMTLDVTRDAMAIRCHLVEALAYLRVPFVLDGMTRAFDAAGISNPYRHLFDGLVQAERHAFDDPAFTRSNREAFLTRSAEFLARPGARRPT